MKINRPSQRVHKSRLRSIPAGKCISICAFHQDCKPDDLYIVLNVCDTYMPKTCSLEYTKGLCNIRSGKLSYVADDRYVTVIDAVVEAE